MSASFSNLAAAPDDKGKYPSVSVQDDSFTRDVMGRITTSTNEVPVSDGTAAAGQVTAECFTYDGFNRLGAAWTVAGTGTAACGSAAPANATATGWDASTTAYAAQWSYSTGGRITSLVKGAAGAPTTSTYTYTDTAHPAAVTQVTNGTTTDSFGYDTAGRMVSRTVDGVSTALTWDVTSSLVESNGQGGHVVYAYDASGQRVVQARVADANGVGTATAYVASGQVDDADTESTSTGDLGATRYYAFGGSTVAVRTNDNKLALMLGDEQGSTNVMMPVTVQTDGTLAKATLADAALVTRTSYTPYGQLRGADNLATDRGWLGQVEDRVVGTGATTTGTGLTYLNARYYDPATSRFISPDPLMNPGDPKTLDPYRYADNNPVVFTDSNGLAPRPKIEGISSTTNGMKASTVATSKTAAAKANTPAPSLKPNVFAPFVQRWNPGPLTLPGSPPNPDDMAAWTAERDRVDANLNGSALRDMTVNGILNQWATSGNHAAYVPWLIPGVGPALRPVFANDHRDANGGLAFQDGSYYSDLLRANRHLQTVVREGIYNGANGVGDSGATFSNETKSLAAPVADASYVADPALLESPAGAEAILGSYHVDYSILATGSRSDGKWVQARVVVSDAMTLASATRLPGVSTADQQKRIAPAEPFIPGYKDMPISAEFTEWFNVG